MKLLCRLAVNGDELPVSGEHVVLSLSAAGRASFVVESEAALSGVVVFDIAGVYGLGVEGDPAPAYQRFFVGVIENSFSVDGSTQRIFCRELTYALNSVLPLMLRNATLSTVTELAKEVTSIQIQQK